MPVVHQKTHEGNWDRILVAIWGDSNATSTGASSALTDQTLALPYPNVLAANQQSNAVGDPIVWSTSSLQAMAPVTFQAQLSVGLEVTLMRDLDARWPRKFVYYRTGLSGSSIANHWGPSAVYPSSGPNLFNLWIAQIQAAIQANDITRLVIVGNQGEPDALAAPGGTAWGTTLFPAFVTAVKNIFGQSTPFVHARVNTACDTGQVPGAANLYTSQTNMTSISGVSMVSLDSITLVSGKYLGLHYTSDGYADMGHLYTPVVEAALGLV